MNKLFSLLPWNWANWVDTLLPDPTQHYPLTTCVVSGDNLEPGAMGSPFDYWQPVEGAGTRLVRLCCPACVSRLERAPERYFALIDDASARREMERAISSARD